MRKYKINPMLVEKQGISNENVEKIESIYKKIAELFEKSIKLSEEYSSKNEPFDKEKAKEINLKVENFEFELQRLWGFKEDRGYHTWWLKNPICKCPKIDNMDIAYSGKRVINCNCPLHG